MQHTRSGNVVTSENNDVLTLSANFTTNSRYMTFERPVGTDYVVPAGHQFRITEIQARCDTATGSVRVGYGDDAVAEGAGAPTNAVIFVHDKVYNCAVAGTQYVFKCNHIVPAGKYPVSFSGAGSGGGAISVEGIEEVAP